MVEEQLEAYFNIPEKAMDEPDPETVTTAPEAEEAPVVLVMVETDSTDVCAADGSGC